MNILKKIGLAVITLSVAIATPVAASEKTMKDYIITDMVETDSGYWEVDEFLNADIVNGYTDTQTGDMVFKPHQNVTRAQFTKILLNAMGVNIESQTSTFTDVKPGDWYHDYVNTAKKMNIVNGINPTTFNPNGKISREQMAAMIVRAFDETIEFPINIPQMFHDVPNTSTFAIEINKAASRGIINGVGDGMFNPRNPATRSQAVIMIYRSISNEEAKVTTEQEVVNVIQNYLTDETIAFGTQNPDDMRKVYDDYGIGYFKVEALQYANYVIDNKDYFQNYVFTGTNENMTHEIQFLSDRYAEVVIGNTFNGAIVDGVESEQSSPSNGVYFLRKVASGDWKIYAFYSEGN